MSVILSSSLNEPLPQETIKTDEAQLEQNPSIDPQSLKTKIGNFILHKNALLGQGSFSKVYRGHDAQNDKLQVAIKVIQKSMLTQQLKKLVDSEIKILRLINHPNIVKCHEILDDENNIYIIMELCLQGDLESRVDKIGPFTEAQSLPIIKGVFKGLLYLSQINVIHRDIKVANVFMHKAVPKIADFGFALHHRTKKQFQDISIGSPIYMSPEGIKHNVYGPKTDVWAFGIFIYQLLHGKTPYSHCTKQKQLKYNISNPLNWTSFKADLSYSIKEVIYKCLEVNYQKRVTFEKLQELDFFRQIPPKNQALTKVDLMVHQILLKSSRSHIKQAPLLYQPVTTMVSPQSTKSYQAYRQSLQKQVSFELSNKKRQKYANKKITQSFNNRSKQQSPQRRKFIELLRVDNKIEKKSKSKQTPRTRDQVISVQNKYKHRPNDRRFQDNLKDKNLTKAHNKNPSPLKNLQKLKTEPHEIDLLTNYREFYQDKKGVKHRKIFRTQISQEYDFQVPTPKFTHHSIGNQSIIRQFKYGQKTVEFNHRHQKVYSQRYNDEQKIAKQPSENNFLRRQPYMKSNKSLRQFQMSRSENYSYGQFYRNVRGQINFNRTIQTKTKEYQKTFVHLQFPRQNISCYLYMIHFSRLLYKLICHLQEKQYLLEIRSLLSRFCLEILNGIKEKIDDQQTDFSKSVNKRKNNPVDSSLMQIYQTTLKYLSQYQSQFQMVSPSTDLNIDLVNSKLQHQMNTILSKSIKSPQPQSPQSIKLLYLGWTYLHHYNEVFVRYILNESSSRYWLEYNGKHIVKEIQKDIETSNIPMNMETYLKIKRKLENRRYS